MSIANDIETAKDIIERLVLEIRKDFNTHNIVVDTKEKNRIFTISFEKAYTNGETLSFAEWMNMQ